MEFFICSTQYNTEEDIDKLLEIYPRIKKYNPIIKSYINNAVIDKIYQKRGLFIEIESLEELIELSNKLYQQFIINDNSYMYDLNKKPLNTIEIYDNWRE